LVFSLTTKFLSVNSRDFYDYLLVVERIFRGL